MNGFEYAQGIHDNLAEPDMGAEGDDTPSAAAAAPLTATPAFTAAPPIRRTP